MRRLHLKISPYLLALVDEVISSTGDSRTATLERLLYGIELLAKNAKLPESVGLDFIEAARVLSSRGLGAKHLDPVRLDGERVDFDVSLLETSNKSKSAFAGVFATTGSTFRALVPDLDNGGTKYLPSRATALRAAIDRYEYFTTNGIPYGNIGKNFEHWKTLHPDWSIEEIFRALRDDVQRTGLKWPYNEEQLEKMIATYYARNPPKAAPAKHKDTEIERNAINRSATLETIGGAKPSRLAAVPDKVFCATCKEEIEEGEPFGPVGKSDYAHTYCITS